MATHYNVLGVKYLNHLSNIKKAYRKLALKHHPDKGGLPKNFRRIQEAYEVLSNEGKRNEYDIELDERRRIEELEKKLQADRQGSPSKTRKNSRNRIMSAIRKAENAEARAYNMIKRAELAQEKASALLGKKFGGRSSTRKIKNRKH